MSEIEVFSPAKVNLFLAVTGRRPDGFHRLSSVVSQVAFGDRVRVKRLGRKGGIELSCSELSLPTDERNLGYKAAAAFRFEHGIEEAVQVNIEKRIPSGAGLGGGSGNASAVLNGLAALFDLRDEAVNFRLAAGIGSDCPLFLGTAPCLMRGRGEIIDSLSAEAAERLAGKRLLIFKPSFSISTIWAYRNLAMDAGNYAAEDWAEQRIADWGEGSLSTKELLFNSFEGVSFRKFPALPLLKERLGREFGARMLMSGSGSACFVLLEGEESKKIEALVKDCLGEDAFFEETTLIE